VRRRRKKKGENEGTKTKKGGDGRVVDKKSGGTNARINRGKKEERGEKQKRRVGKESRREIWRTRSDEQRETN